MNSIKEETNELVKINNLSESEKQEIMNIKNDISLNSECILSFGSAASKNLNEFSTDLLKTMKVKDNPDVEEMIASLISGLSEVDPNTLVESKPSFLKRLFKVDDVKTFMTKYENVSAVIDEVKKKLELAQYQLKKDTELCNRYLEQNIFFIQELDKYILAGKLKLEEAKSSIKAEELEIDKTDALAVQKISLKQNEIDRLERKIHDLELRRQVGIQNIPQIILIQQGDSILIEKIGTSIDSAIPLWENQMVLAIQMMRQRGALAIQRSVTDTTNRLLEANSKLLKQESIEVAKELERGIIDVEVLKKTTTNLIETLEGSEHSHHLRLR